MARRRSPTPAERDLWRRTMQDVVPLRSLPADPVPPPAPTGVAAPDAAAPAKRARKAVEQRPLPPGPAAPPPAPSPPPILAPILAPGVTPGVDRRTADRLRRGRLPVEARLDLHGMGRETAHEALIGFIGASHAIGRRCVLVITGKGTFSPDRKGVLRAAVPRWLNEAPLRGKVLAIDTARPQDGGGGAYYILLKRQRDR